MDEEWMEAFWGIFIPFLGTSLGAACVFFMKKSLGDGVQRALTGFAAGVMVAASVWSLLIPAIEQVGRTVCGVSWLRSCDFAEIIAGGADRLHGSQRPGISELWIPQRTDPENYAR